jgi:hypothetical protein
VSGLPATVDRGRDALDPLAPRTRSNGLPVGYIPGRRIEALSEQAKVRRARGERVGKAAVLDCERPSASERRVDAYRQEWGLYGPDSAPSLDDWVSESVGSDRRPALRRDCAQALEDAIRDGSGWRHEAAMEYAFLLAREYLAQSEVQLVGVREVCDRYGFQRMTLKRLRDRGEFSRPFGKLAAGPVWRERDLPQEVGGYTLSPWVEDDGCPF